MARTDFTSPRLYVDAPLSEGGGIALAPEQANYLLNVLRLRAGARVLALAATANLPPASKARAAKARRSPSARSSGLRNLRPTSTISSRRSNTPVSTIWRRRRWKWAPAG
jgi:hypothetical protein